MGQLNFRLPERPPPLLSYPGQPMLTSPTVHSGTLDFIIPRLELRLQKGNAETRQYLKKWKVGRECCDLIAVFWDVSLCWLVDGCLLASADNIEGRLLLNSDHLGYLQASDIFCMKKGKYLLHNHAVVSGNDSVPLPSTLTARKEFGGSWGLVPAKTNAEMPLALETSLWGRDGQCLWKGPDSKCFRFCRLHRVSVANFFIFLNNFSNPLKM